jgi:methyl coenzyme M reductase beta subunit
VKKASITERVAAKNVAAKLRGGKAIVHVVFEQWEVEFWQGKEKKIAVVGVWLDLKKVANIAGRAATNQNRKSRQGAVNAEMHFIK